jgi:bifunctional enzyme CysN/CysC
MVCWVGEQPMTAGTKYALKHTTRWCRAVVRDQRYRLDINTLHRDATATSLALNEIGRVKLRTTSPLLCDSYRRNRSTGSFILVDEATNATVGAGMIIGASD